ncbi:hypothetical protein FSP39_022205 [Pinctada imbricata]|uniref:AXH domain-containing protein n=1 Tax=Pinctada imbricata TaxID=66713 RepID=A0AA88Y0A2_PINIB|nr:hypothetical protein FSP39_022205 [Pinctada imbricata]
MTGSTPGSNGENLNWLTDVSSCQGIVQRPSDSLHSSSVSGQSNYSTSRSSTMLASAASPGGMPGVFRPPMTLSDASARLLSGGSSQFPTLYSAPGNRGSSSQLSPYLGGHDASTGQSAHLSPHYSAFYTSQYPNYPSRALLTNPNYPHIESYSAVLQSMGSQVHTQLPRNTYGHVSQYSLMGTSHQRSMSASVSPSPEVASHHAPANPGNSIAGHGEAIPSDLKSRIDIRERKLHEQEYLSHIKEERTHSLSAIELSGGKSVSFKDPPHRDLVSTKDSNYKVPSGKEGSLKHRILTRPSDSAIQSSMVDSRYSSYASQQISDEPSAKRSKYSTSSAAPSKSTHSAEVASGNISSAASPQSQLHYPPHFMKGSIIQLTNGELKRVEDLQTEDFVQSAEISDDLKIDSSTVVKIEESVDRGTAILGFVVGEHKVQVTVEATLEHPFFVFGQGWSSCEPDRTLQRYGLECQRLSVGDVCISLTHKDVTAHAAEISQQQRQLQLKNQQSPHQVPSPSSNPASQRSPKDSQGQGHSVPSPNNRSGNSPFPTQDHYDAVNRPPRKRNWSSSSLHENESGNVGQGDSPRDIKPTTN